MKNQLKLTDIRSGSPKHLENQLNQQYNWSRLHPDEPPIMIQVDPESIQVHPVLLNKPTTFAEILRRKL